MKKIIYILIMISLAFSFSFADCGALMSKYSAPDPGSKTMKQIKRWVKRKVKDAGDAGTLQECMIAGAADNPNQEKVAGK